MDGTGANTPAAAADQSNNQKIGTYALLIATTLIAIMYTIDSLNGRPTPWSRRAWLIGLFGVAVLRFIGNKTLRLVIMIVSILFVLDGIYATFNHM